MTIFKWSRTAGSNDVADQPSPGNIDWREGQSPATVNDSARGMMAAVAKYRDDISGRINTTGTSTAYLLTSFQQFTSLALMDGAMIAFVPNVTCGATVTLNVDSLGAKPLRPAPGVELIAGQLIAGTPYAATYNNASGIWFLQNILGNFIGAMPIGGIMPYAANTAPSSNFAMCNGQGLAGASFTALRDILQAASPTFPYGGNATTFNIPDLRGRIIAGLDQNVGGFAVRINGTAQGGLNTDGGFNIKSDVLASTGGSQFHVQIAGEMPTHNHTGSTATDGGHAHSVKRSNAQQGAGSGFTYMDGLGAAGNANTESGTAAISLSIASQGSSNAMAWLQPTIIIPYIIRVL